jgi:hypothetical protein
LTCGSFRNLTHRDQDILKLDCKLSFWEPRAYFSKELVQLIESSDVGLSIIFSPKDVEQAAACTSQMGSLSLFKTLPESTRSSLLRKQWLHISA